MPLLARDLMWSQPPMILPTITLKEAAKQMDAVNAGVLPVGKNGKLEGIITDRDIVVRAVSKGKSPEQERVSGYMTSGIHSCKESSTIREAAELMKKKKVSRLVVVNDRNEFSGILSFGHIFRDEANAEEAADIVTRVSNRNGKARNGKTKKPAAAA